MVVLLLGTLFACKRESPAPGSGATETSDTKAEISPSPGNWDTAETLQAPMGLLPGGLWWGYGDGHAIVMSVGSGALNRVAIRAHDVTRVLSILATNPRKRVSKPNGSEVLVVDHYTLRFVLDGVRCSGEWVGRFGLASDPSWRIWMESPAGVEPDVIVIEEAVGTAGPASTPFALYRFDRRAPAVTLPQDQVRQVMSAKALLESGSPDGK